MRFQFALAALLVALAALVMWIYSEQADARSDAAATTIEQVRAPAAPTIEAPLETHDAASPRAERSRDTAATRSLSGRVVDARSAEALAGFGVVARNREEVWCEDVSDARGRFLLTGIAATAATIVVTPPYGWIALDTPRTVASNARGEFDEVRILARPAGFAPFRARLVDEVTREPVPHYLVRVGDQLGARASAWSNELGELVGEQQLPESLLLLFFYDVLHPDRGGSQAEPYCYREVRHTPRDGASEELELAIPVGPTYRLDLDAPAQALDGRLLAHVSRAGASFPRAGSAQHPHVGVVRSNDGFWVRLPPQAARGFDPAVLGVFSLDGRWFGEGPVSTRRGIDPVRVPIRLERRSRLLGRVLDDRGDAIAKATLTLFGVDRDGAFSRLETAASSANGLFEFPFAPPGLYIVRGTAAGAEARELEIAAPHGEDVEFELVLPLLVQQSIVSGVVIAPRDSELAKCNVLIASSRHAGQLFQQRAVFVDTPGGLVASFEFREAPAGEYVLHVSAWSASGGELQDITVDVTAPSEDVVVELPAARGLLCIEPQAVDADSKAPIEAITLELQAEGAARRGPLLGRRDDGCLSSESLPTTRWVLGAEGYRPVTGAAASLDFVGGVAKLTVELTAGWGVMLEVLGPGHAPLADVEVLADGKPVATTDSAGRALLSLAKRPRALELRRTGWRTELDSSSALNGAVRDDSPLLRVWMAPR